MTDSGKRERWRRAAWLGLKLAVASGALGWMLVSVDLDEMLGAFERISLGAALGALALTLANFLVGALRWWLVLGAYGAKTRPTILRLARIYLVGAFYNTFLPGNVGGDLLRGHVTRRAFGGGAASYMVVAIERVFGLSGLLLLGAAVLTVHPVGGVEGLGEFAALGVLAAFLAALAPIIGRRLAPVAPRRFRALLGALPAVERPQLLLIVLALSVATQTVAALAGHALVSSIDGSVALADSLVLVPVALIALYFPATVAGLGVREAAFVLLFTRIGVERADATAASLAYLAVMLVVAGAGGLVHVLLPLEPAEGTS